MSHGWFKGSALTLMMAGMLAAGGALAQTAAPDAAPAPAADAARKPAPKAKISKAKEAKPKAKKLPTVTVTVKNGRSVGLVELTAALPGSGDAVKIVGALAAGKKAVAHVAHEKDCLVDLHGTFADGAETDISSVEICKDKKINLTD